MLCAPQCLFGICENPFPSGQIWEFRRQREVWVENTLFAYAASLHTTNAQETREKKRNIAMPTTSSVKCKQIKSVYRGVEMGTEPWACLLKFSWTRCQRALGLGTLYFFHSVLLTVTTSLDLVGQNWTQIYKGVSLPGWGLDPRCDRTRPGFTLHRQKRTVSFTPADKLPLLSFLLMAVFKSENSHWR